MYKVDSNKTTVMKKIYIMLVFVATIISVTFAQDLKLNFSSAKVRFKQTSGYNGVEMLRIAVPQGDYFSCKLYSKKGEVKGEFRLEPTFDLLNRPIVVVYGIQDGFDFKATKNSFSVNGEEITELKIKQMPRPMYAK